VIESIQSRLQIIKIPQITREHIRDIMTRILEKENICMEDDAAEFLLNLSNNSVRIMINYLEKISFMRAEQNSDKFTVTFELCNKLCTDIPYKVFEDYTLFVKSGNIIQAIEIFYKIFDYGYSVIDILYSYFLFIKTAFHNIHEDSIELALFTRNFAEISL
jgi:DNA polymerase III gamma/tau subunit